MQNSIAYTALVLLSLVPLARADNWAHWRGPTGNGVANNASPPVEWSDTKNVRWKVEIPGRENSSPVIWDQQVFVTTAAPVGGEKESAKKDSEFEFQIFSFDRSTGKPLWQQTATVLKPHEGTHATNGFASASPCTDGQHVYAHFGSRGLYCYTMDGKLVWKRDDLGEMETLMGFGEGSSPTLAGDKILVPWDHQGPSALYALDKLTGKTVWKADRDETTCWSTPLVVEHEGKKQVITNGQKFARSYDLETGKELWRCAGQTRRPVASPVAANNMVYIGSGFQGAFLGAFKLNGEGDVQGTDQVAWVINRDTPDIASPLLTNGRIFFHKGKSGLLSCVDALTGKPHFTAIRIPGIDTTYASPVAAGGHVYLTGLNGTTVVIKDADELEIVATNSVDEVVGGTPAPVDNQLFIRGSKHLFCIADAE